MASRELRFTNYIEKVPIAGTCTACGEVFSVMLVSDEPNARVDLDAKFKAHKCRSREDVNQAAARIVRNLLSRNVN